LRYPGGKASFAKFISELMVKNGLSGGHYLEPYAGGAGVALDLLFSGKASHIHINDVDPAVHAFWTSVVKHTDELLELLECTPITLDEWFKWRSILREETTCADVVKKGFATLFMNRTNRSGILKAGVIGGKKQDGAYKLDARFKKDVISSRIQDIAKRAENISIYCEDSLSLLQRCHEFLPAEALIYLDPPYYVKGRGLYRNYYQHQDHMNISNLIQSGKFHWPWVVSYDNAEQIRGMYSASRSIDYSLHYTAQRKYMGSEVMFFSDGLIIPSALMPKPLLAA